ncbi:MAG: exopolysaccharide biosynthesis polyprenyl glycosylphosphotransferase [Candidatus Omnitrophota bacterium]
MKLKNISSKKFAAAAFLMMAVILILGTTAYATLSQWENFDLVETSLTPNVLTASDTGVADLTAENKSRAPEPSTMALLFTGLCGAVVSFVRKTYRATKRLLDIAAGITGLIVLSPLYALVALLIKLSSRGPVFYTQTRVGQYGRVFTMYKFRTMKVDAEKETGAVWAKESDDRLIPVGKFLRKMHIDEIPQFVNILKGDMSLIGPRPERPEFVEKFKTEIPEYERRLMVKPGLTGLAQVRHHYDRTIEDVRKKIKLDLLYIRRLCLWTDVRIFFRTFRVVLTGEGAH